MGRVILLRACKHEVQHCSCLLCPGLRNRDLTGMKLHHIADGAQGVPAGQRIVADIGDAVGREQLIAERQYFFLHGVINPGEYAVADNVIEFSQRPVSVKNRHVSQLNIG